MNELRAAMATCRLCDAPVARDADVCASCGVKAPWVPDEPSVNLRAIRLAMARALLHLSPVAVSGRCAGSPGDHR